MGAKRLNAPGIAKAILPSISSDIHGGAFIATHVVTHIRARFEVKHTLTGPHFHFPNGCVSCVMSMAFGIFGLSH